MLVEFSVENFRSIKESQTLSFLSSRLSEHEDHTVVAGEIAKLPLLKTSVLYGANASGKSNLLLALGVLSDFVTNSTDTKMGQLIRWYDPHRLDNQWKTAPTKFKIEFIEYEMLYEYTLHFDLSKVLFEELAYYPHRKRAVLFRRELDEEQMYFGSRWEGSKREIERQLMTNVLFLSKAANSNHKQMADVYEYFSTKILIHPNEHFADMQNKSLTSRVLALEFEQGKDYAKRAIAEVLRVADTGIQEIRLEERDPPANFSTSELPEEFGRALETELTIRVLATHDAYEEGVKVGEVEFDISNESAGTKAMYGLLGQILNAMRFGATLIIDELDKSLHPLIARLILDLFNHSDTNAANAQLICSTHDVSLLANEILRRDQVWFTEKDRFGATTLFPLVEFDTSKVRKTTRIDRWYLDGRFGALPNIDDQLTLFPLAASGK